MATRVCDPGDRPHPPTLPFTSMAVCNVRTLCVISDIESEMTLLVTLKWTDSTWKKDAVLQPEKMNIPEDVLQTMTNPIVTAICKPSMLPKSHGGQKTKASRLLSLFVPSRRCDSLIGAWMITDAQFEVHHLLVLSPSPLSATTVSLKDVRKSLMFCVLAGSTLHMQL